MTGRFLALGGLGLLLVATGCASGYSKCTANSDCGTGQFCDTGLKTCFPIGTKPDSGSPGVWMLAWVSPSGGTVVRGTNATVTAKLTPPDDKTTLPSSIALATNPAASGVPTSLVLDGGVYQATWGPQAENTYKLTASFQPPDAGELSKDLTLTVDRPPNLGIYVPPASWPLDVGNTTYRDPSMPSAFRRDDSATVTVYSASNDVSSAQLFVTDVRDGGSSPQPVSLRSCTDAGTHQNDNFCGQVTLDLGNYRLDALDGTFALVATATDNGGNLADAGTDLQVTRWEWSYDTGSSATNNTAAPAVGQDGTVYIGTSDSTGHLYAVNPDGTSKWANPPNTGPVTASPAVGKDPSGNDRIYVLQAGPNSGDYGISAYDNTGTPIGGCFQSGTAPGSSDSPSSLSIAPADAGIPETAMAVINAGTGKGTVLAWQPETSSTSCTATLSSYSNPNGPPPNLNSANAYGALAGDGLTIYYGTPTPGTDALHVESYYLSGSTLNPNWTSPPDVSLQVRSLVVLANGAGIAGGGGLSSGGIFKISADGTALTEYPQAGYGTTYPFVYNVVSDSSGHLFAGMTTTSAVSEVSRVDINATPPQETPAAPLTDSLKTAPLLTSSGTLYALSDTGTLFSFDSTDLTALGSESLDLSGATVTAPNIACAQKFDGTPVPGEAVLYFGTSGGRLDAILIDSDGLDTTAGGWPKYLHDPRNTSNAQTDLSQFSCSP